jgi:hypothetical protein
MNEAARLYALELARFDPILRTAEPDEPDIEDEEDDYDEDEAYSYDQQRRADYDRAVGKV